MARNKVQFQKGMSEAQFDNLYGTEAHCRDALVRWRWPQGFECPACTGRAHCIVERGARILFQCNACRKQTSVKAGTVFASSKLPLRLWFRAMSFDDPIQEGHFQHRAWTAPRRYSNNRLDTQAQTRPGDALFSAKKRRPPAPVMIEHNASKRMDGEVQIDDAYIGGQRSGRRRMAPPF
jgi:ribosomal protein L37AE/L43A